MKIFAITIIMIANIAFLGSIIWYALNRSKYYEMLSEFQKNHIFPAPYYFSSMIGFFGAPLMTYFFLRLKKRKKIFFLAKDSDAYTFPNSDINRSMAWLSVFNILLTICMSCYVVLMIIAVILEAKSKFFP